MDVRISHCRVGGLCDVMRLALGRYSRVLVSLAIYRRGRITTDSTE